MAVDFLTYVYAAIIIVVNIIVNSLFVWLSGRALVGPTKAKFSDAFWIVALGSIISGVIGALAYGVIGDFIGALIAFILYLFLIQHFFDCGLVKAFIIAIVAVIIQIVIALILALIFGIAILTFGL